MEHSELKNLLYLKIKDYIASIDKKGFDFCMPDNVEELMTTAAFSVLEAIAETDKHFRTYHILKEEDKVFYPGNN